MTATPKEETAVAVVDPSHSAAIARLSIGEMRNLARDLALARALPSALKQSAPDVLLILMTGNDLGISPVAALRSIHIIEGKPSLSADLMVAICLRSPECLYFRQVSGDATEATYVTKRRGEPEKSFQFTLEEAQHLLKKDNWKNYPAAMLRARAKSALAREIYPDLLHGMYTAEELGHDIEMIDAGGGVFIPAATDTLRKKVEQAESLEQLEQLIPEIKQIEDPRELHDMRIHYSAAKRRLTPVRGAQELGETLLAAETLDEVAELEEEIMHLKVQNERADLLSLVGDVKERLSQRAEQDAAAEAANVDEPAEREEGEEPAG